MTNPYQLTDDEKSFIETNAMPFEMGWHAIAIFADAKIEMDHWPKQDVEQAIGLIAHRKAETIRSWRGMRKAIGDELLDTYHDRYGIEHWRQIRRAAKRDGVTIASLADRFDTGASISPETLAVELNGKKPKRDPLSAAKARLYQALASIEKHAGDKYKQRVVDFHIEAEKVMARVQ